MKLGTELYFIWFIQKPVVRISRVPKIGVRIVRLRYRSPCFRPERNGGRNCSQRETQLRRDHAQRDYKESDTRTEKFSLHSDRSSRRRMISESAISEKHQSAICCRACHRFHSGVRPAR